jgi:hypothetical protein
MKRLNRRSADRAPHVSKALAVVGLLLALQALADPAPLGFYVGGSVGDSNLDQGISDLASAFPRSFPSNVLGWKLMVGSRVSRLFGGELEYLDFGTPRLGPAWLVTENGVPLEPDEFFGAHADVRAAAASGLVYLPLLPRWIDLFAKLGVARLWTSNSAAGYWPDVYTCAIPDQCVAVGRVSQSQSAADNGFVYGGGAQTHFGAFSLRLEYERISSDIGDPSLISFGVTWTFR